jgi:hemoglobin/transferrin/lactoferrin receptor protein
MRKTVVAFLASIAGLWTHAQETVSDSTSKELSEVVISASKFPEKKLNIAQRIDVISSKYISRVNAQNTGDLLINTGNVFVQKSQQGGSSPVIRGFEASRVLLVVDGVRLNTLIYRAGHLFLHQLSMAAMLWAVLSIFVPKRHCSQQTEKKC